MALMTDKNLQEYQKYLDMFHSNVNSWSANLDEVEGILNNNIGNSFKQKYSVGRKAAENMQKVIDILQTLQGDLNKLLADAKAFYMTAYKASQK